MSRITVTVSPSASRSELLRRHGDGWKARVAAPPERGRANEALVAMLAEALELPKTAVRVISGQTARRKVVEIDGLDLEEARRRLDAAARG